MTEQGSASSVPSLLEATVGQIRQAAASLPVEDAGHAQQTLAGVAEMLGVTAHETQHEPLAEAQARVMDAAGHAGAAAGLLDAGRSALEEYTTSVTGEDTHKYAPVYVEQRTYGDTNYTVALADHTPEHVDAIADALKGCDVIALEAAGGGTSEERAELQNIYATLLSPDTDAEVAKKTFEDLKRLDPTVIPRILERFIGSGKRVYLFDTPKDSPDYELIQKAEAARKVLQFLVDSQVSNTVPVAALRSGTLAALNATAASHAMRTPLVGYQLQWLDGQLPAGSHVGVMVGKEHFGFLEDLDTQAGNAAATEAVAERIYQTGSTWTKGLMYRMATGGIPPELVDRYLLSLNMAVYTTGDMKVSDAVVGRMTDEQVDEALSGVEYVAASKEIAPADKKAMLADYYQKITGIFTPKAAN